MSDTGPSTGAPARHPLRRPAVLLPVLGVLALVQLPFLHQALRGDAKVVATVPFVDRFDRAELGEAWWSNGGHWRIVDGQLYSPGVGNNPLWLRARLPDDVRIEFDVRSEGPDGDAKWEVFGDGRNHETGYLFLFGAWHNRETRLARLAEHALTTEELRAQLELRLTAVNVRHGTLDAIFGGLREAVDRAQARRELAALQAGKYYGPATPRVVKRLDWKVERGKTVHVRITRRGGLLRWEQDGALVLELDDPAPLRGSGHDRFGFSSWENDTWFDNLSIAPL